MCCLGLLNAPGLYILQADLARQFFTTEQNDVIVQMLYMYHFMIDCGPCEHNVHGVYYLALQVRRLSAVKDTPEVGTMERRQTTQSEVSSNMNT